ncbi:VOC family protein [Georgenia thermotolerans]|uniref:VOC family protein n=1 Tax=Georgenia thermotolerans TaxID=527326 RepID=A0A7J5UPJ9_9MICO|nr:VOC family protein [Georgenia thermotolerans]KAE8764034.1 VOC family protein [Georgenia thermotolerans]
MPHVALVNVLVHDYDEAIAFYTGAFGLRLLEDSPQGGGKRWVVVGSPDDGAGLRLAQATREAQRARVGNQAGDGVGFFLHVEDFDATLERALAHGAVATEEPRQEPHGRVIILEDLYGNRWDVIEPAADER